MADAQAKIEIVLDDKASGPAATAAQALRKLQSSIEGDKKELAAMQAAMKQLQSGTTVNVAAFKELQGRIDAQKNKISESTAKFVELGGRFTKTKGEAKEAGGRFKELGETMGKMPGPIGRLGASLSSVTGQLSTGKLLAMAAAAAFVVLGVAVLGAAAHLAAFGVESGNARRSQELHFEAISRMRRGYVGLRESAGAVMGAIDRVAGSTATSREQVARFAEILQRGGVRGANFETALRAASIKAAALGDDSGAAFAQMAVGASRAGVSVNRLASDVQARFGGIAARRLLDLGVMTTKLHENFNSLFDGLNFEPLLGIFHEVVGFFSQSTATGRALKSIVTALFQPMINSAGEATPIVKRFFQGIVIAALHTAIAILLVRRWWRDTFGRSALGGIDSMKIALYAGAVAFGVLALAAGIAALAIVAAGLAIAAPFIVAGAAIYGIIRAFQAGRQIGTDLVNDWKELGPRIVDGLVNGLRGAFGRARTAIRELGTSLINDWKDILGIHSPSRVFAGLGEQIPAGVEVGIARGESGLNSSVSSMMEIPTSAPGAGSSSVSASRSSAATITVGEVHIHTQTNDPASLAESFRDQLARVLEGFGGEIGATS